MNELKIMPYFPSYNLTFKNPCLNQSWNGPWLLEQMAMNAWWHVKL